MSLLPSDPISAGLSSAKTIAIIVVIAAISGTIGYLAYTKSLLETKVADDALEIFKYQQANIQCVAQVGDVNKLIEQYKQETADRAKEADKLVADTKKAQQDFDSKIKDLQAKKPSGDDCAATKGFANRYFKGLR